MNGQIVATRLVASLDIRVVRAVTRKHCSRCHKRRLAHALAVIAPEGSFISLGPWLCRECVDA
jgi:uncharacterized membrane protein